MHIYLGTFLIALTTLALEVTLSRLLSVIVWYYLAFFAISTAMLGMTAGATRVYLSPHTYRLERFNIALANACQAYAVSIPASLLVLCFLPLNLYGTLTSILALIVATVACALPFYFAGIVVTVVLTKSPWPIGKVYASDLLGAAIGCLFVLGALNLVDAVSLMILCASIGMLAALSFAWPSARPRRRLLTIGFFLLGIALTILNAATTFGLRPHFIKERYESASDYFLERWNSLSRVVVYKGEEENPMYWGPGWRAPSEPIFQYEMNIDGVAGTVLAPFATMDDIGYLAYDVTNIAYYLRPQGGACIIGVGGGRDIQSALLFGHERIVGIDINPIFIDLLQNEFRDFAGLADRECVRLVADEARSHLSRTDEEFSILQMSMIDTWASTTAGAFSLSENGLYTVEAWGILFERLKPDGILTVSRWHHPQSLGETGRVVSLAVATLLNAGIENPAQHIALVSRSRISTLLVSKQPLSPADITTLMRECSRLRFLCVIAPGQETRVPILRNILEAQSLDDLHQRIAGEALNLKPPTDESPFFFNMLRLDNLKPAFHKKAGMVHGNLVATIALLLLLAVLLVVSLATVVFPLMVRKWRRGRGIKADELHWSGALYFSLIGAGFMLLEIALIQRLSVFLGHPAYALGILLSTLIASAGLGSLLSETLPLSRRPWIYIYPVVVAFSILAVRFGLGAVLPQVITAAMATKILVAIAVVFPLGILMGLFFPTGMRLVRNTAGAETPWYWALNGIFGVLCSALAVFLSIYFGIATNFYIAAACYMLVLFCLHRMHRGQDAAVGRA